ncbi:MAG TPA: GntR family transcriptional regulator [Candidatus Caccousia stercoris]|uniref:GntR family transcriptional regulator n=1 Tax=Candidatus Caccousia stercoris TaxID=2840723 RepID=A0A9D1K1B1_9FIRM|nr:GntR family transcriptional regulator [Candidatus Caccousia stercoris]
MVSFDGFSLTDGIPIYQQILLFLKREAVAGTIRDGDELPSRRVLSALLGVNPNTIQKAYRMLEEEGLIASHSGAKSLMVLNEETLRRVRGELLEADAKGVVNAMKQMGLTKEEALALIDQYWE